MRWGIEKFSHRSVCVIEGSFDFRSQLYTGDDFFKVVNYDVVARDLKTIIDYAPDLVILDEAQRIKNWKTRIAQSVKQIKSPYAFVLTGTPLENRLEELHSIVEFVDRYRLGPMFRFLSNHQVIDKENGKVVGYQNLKAIGQTLSSILVRRTKNEVLKQLPPGFTVESRGIGAAHRPCASAWTASRGAGSKFYFRRNY